jgi:hypothetical protein
VRQTELACRNSWDQDLWEQSPNPVLNPALTGVEYSTGIDSEAPAASIDHDIQRRAPREIFLGDTDDGSETDLFGDDIDRVTDIQVPMLRRASFARPPARTIGREGDQAQDDEHWLPRTSVYDARRRLEEERREFARQQHESRVSEIGNRMASTNAIGSPYGAFPPIVRNSEPARSSQGSSELESDEHSGAHSSREERRGADTPEAQQVSPGQQGLRGAVRMAPIVDPEVDQRTEPLPTQEVRAATGFADQSVILDRNVTDSVVHVDGAVHVAWDASVALPANERFQAAKPTDPIDRHKAIQAIRRCCGTCRDFRQVADGGRGQCVNPYAFSERRMVQSDQLACRSSLGTWWMPNDDVWLERADTSHHGRPTPLLDATYHAQRSSEVGRDSRNR